MSSRHVACFLAAEQPNLVPSVSIVLKMTKFIILKTILHNILANKYFISFVFDSLLYELSNNIVNYFLSGYYRAVLCKIVYTSQ